MIGTHRFVNIYNRLNCTVICLPGPSYENINESKIQSKLLDFCKIMIITEEPTHNNKNIDDEYGS